MSDALPDGFAEVLAMVEPGARLLRAWTLAGGLSAQMTALEAEWPNGARRRLIVRRARNSRRDLRSLSIQAEFRLLVRLRALGLPTPQPRLVDDSGRIFDHPYAVFDYVHGSPQLSISDPTGPSRVLAAQLAAIHQIDVSGSGFSDLPRRAAMVGRRLAERPKDLDYALSEDVIREVLSASWPPPEPDRPCLLHGDFWPGNVLWANGEVVAVIDWEDASVGDPLADVGTTRLDLLWAFGPTAMSGFTADYFTLRSCDSATLPLWDLVAALRPAGALSSWAADWVDLGRPDVNAATMRSAHKWFVDQALGALRNA